MPSTTDGGANDALDVRALRSSIAAAFNTRADGPPTASAGAQTPRSSVARAVPVTLGPVRPSAIGAYGSEIEEPPMEVDPSTPFPVAPPVPLSIPDAEAAEAWLSAPATWECLAVGVLRHDLMSYRTLMQRALNSLEVHPCATLRTLANFTWQYKEPHPSHALSAKETAHAILALCHTAALGHLPCPHGEGWSARQCEVAASVHSVLDALEEGFPVPSARVRSRILAERVEDESAWHVESKGATLGALLCGYIDAAVEA